MKPREKTSIKDPFLWLEKDSKRRNQWIELMEKESMDYFSESKELRRLRSRFKKLLSVDQMRLPVVRGNSIFYRFRKFNEESASLYMRKGVNGKETLLINPTSLPKEWGNIIAGWSVSWDAQLIVVEISKSGNDRKSLRIFDVKKKRFLKHFIPETNFPDFNTWDKDSRGFWYVRGTGAGKKGEEKYYKSIFYCDLNKNTKDSLYFGTRLAKDDWPSIKLSDDKKYALITIHDVKNRTRIFLKDTEGSDDKVINITKGISAESYANIHGGKIFLNTNHNAPNRKIITRSIYSTKLSDWKTLIREKEFPIEGFSISRGIGFIEYLENVHSRLYTINIKKRKIQEIHLPEMGTIHGWSLEVGGNDFYFTFSSFKRPYSIYKISINNLKMRLFWKSSPDSGGLNIQVEQEWYKSKDGTRIPMFIVYKKGLVRNGNNPTLVSAYGGFGVPVIPTYSHFNIPFIEDGGVYVLVNIRGGGEFGEKWHKSAIKKKRQKSFDDFAYALKYLIRKKYTNPNKIAIEGGSNGGLLMCVTAIQNPTLFKAALISVPVTDMLRFHLFNGGRWWISDYGDPENKSMREYLLKYSPYHNVKNINYPSMLFCTSEHDDRVNPLHTFKMVMRLKKNPSQKNPVLLRIERGAGHGGANVLTTRINESSEELSFIYKELNIHQNK